MRLGKREIDALTCPPDRQDMMVFDDQLPGFALRVTRAGKKVFLFQFRFAGSLKRMVLGDYGVLTPAQARAKAEEARGKVREGRDPLGERKAAQAASVAADTQAKRQKMADALTVNVLIERWAAMALKDRRPAYSREAVRALRVNLPELLLLPAASVDHEMAQRSIDAVALDRGETMARRSHAYARALYGWATKRRLVPSNPFSEVHTEGREVSRDRALSDAELREVWQATDGLGLPFGPYFKILILTLQRRSEVAGMRWSELSPDRTTWTVPAERAKNGRAHLVHLPEAARAILSALPRMPQGFGKRPSAGRMATAYVEDSPASDLVFTTTGDTPVSGVSKAKARLDELISKARAKTATQRGQKAPPAAIAPWRLHDLRRTGVTALARLGTPPHVADRLLNHVEATGIQGVAAVYQRHDFLTERQAASEAWAAHVLKLVQ